MSPSTLSNPATAEAPAREAPRFTQPGPGEDRPGPAGAGTPAADRFAEAPAKTSRRPLAFAALAVLALAGAALGARQYLWARDHVSTDDAQVEGDVVPVLAKVSGYVTAVIARENQRVSAGDLLVQVDDREYRAKLAQREGDLAAAIAAAGTNGRVGQADAQLAAARAAVAQARANAERARADVQRYRALAPRGVVSQQQLDGAEAAAAASAAGLEAAQKQALAGEAALQGADAKAAAARAQRDQEALNLSWTRVVAPLEGVVSRKNVEVGQLVNPGQALMSVVPLDDVWIVANLKETEIAGVDPGDRAEVKVDAYPGRRFAARVESLAAATGAKFSLLPPDNATGNFTKVVQRIPVRLRLDKPQDPAHPLRPGMSVQVTIATR